MGLSEVLAKRESREINVEVIGVQLSLILYKFRAIVIQRNYLESNSMKIKAGLNMHRKFEPALVIANKK
jgi:hypothetical protein